MMVLAMGSGRVAWASCAARLLLWGATKRHPARMQWPALSCLLQPLLPPAPLHNLQAPAQQYRPIPLDSLLIPSPALCWSQAATMSQEAPKSQQPSKGTSSPRYYNERDLETVMATS